MTRVAVVTPEPIGDQMAGPAIRAWNMAEVLARTHDVRLVTTSSASITSPTFDVHGVDVHSIVDDRSWADVIVTHPGVLRTHPAVGEDDTIVVVDLYDPFHLENLEPDGRSLDDRMSNVRHLTSVINDAAQRGDYFLCATEQQRDFWLGSLTSLGRVNPATYDLDPTMSSLIGVVPFGIPTSPPRKRRDVLRGVVPGISHEDRVLLWGGGVYNWFDPLTLIRAVDLARHDVPRIRLVFLGMTHPNPDLPPMAVAVETRELADALELTDRHVFFNEGWVPYDERADYLLEADVGVSTHQLHIETTFSFRTRLLDYLWAALPIITSEGDAFAELMRSDDIGRAVPPSDPAALAAAIVDLLQHDEARQTCSSNARRIAGRFHWTEVLEPLVAFCDAPRPAPDRGLGAPQVAASPPRNGATVAAATVEDGARVLASLDIGQRSTPRPWRKTLSSGQERWISGVLAAAVAPGSRVLERGCGHGTFSSSLLRLGYEIDALDEEPPELLATLQELGGHRYRFQLAPDPVHLPFPDGSFDAVASVGLLEHVRDLGGTEGQSLAEIARVLRPGGVFVCGRYPRRADWIELVARRPLRDRTDRHRQLLRRTDVTSLVATYGLEAVEVPRDGMAARSIAGPPPSSRDRRASVRRLIAAGDLPRRSPFDLFARNLGFVAVKGQDPYIPSSGARN